MYAEDVLLDRNKKALLESKVSIHEGTIDTLFDLRVKSLTPRFLCNRDRII